MSGWVVLDTAHVSVKYPRKDVFQRWYEVYGNASDRARRQGIVSGECVVRGGASGYKGMGIWVQLGPKFLLAHPESFAVGVADFLRVVGVTGEWPARISRLDLAVDLPGVQMSEIPLGKWREDWVGWSRVSSMFYNSETGDLETVNIGSRGSVVYLRVYDKVVQAEKDGDLAYWREVWGGFDGPVCRVEWETRPGAGGFNSIADMDSYREAELVGLGRYLVGWGRLCDRNDADSNRTRWPSSVFWRRVEEAVEEWAEGSGRVAERIPRTFQGVNDRYIRFVSGVVSSGMARLGNGNVSLVGLLDGLREHGEPLQVIQKRAAAKAERLERL
jgi:hypothetical protein